MVWSAPWYVESGDKSSVDASICTRHFFLLVLLLPSGDVYDVNKII